VVGIVPTVEYNKVSIFKRNSLASEFITQGMDKRFKHIQNYNSLKYSKNSPRGKEVRLLSAHPNLNMLNLTSTSFGMKKSKLHDPISMRDMSEQRRHIDRKIMFE
jgi:hypothetical protein